MLQAQMMQISNMNIGYIFSSSLHIVRADFPKQNFGEFNISKVEFHPVSDTYKARCWVYLY